MSYNQSKLSFSTQLLIRQLIILIHLFNLAACDKCSSKFSANSPELQLKVVQKNEGDAYTIQIDILNSGNQTAFLNETKLVAMVTDEIGGNGTTLLYELMDGTKLNGDKIDGLVSNFVETQELIAKDIRSIKLGISPGKKVTNLKLRVAIVNMNSQQNIAEQEIRCHFIKENKKILWISSKSDAINNKGGTFFIQVTKEGLNPHEIEVSLSSPYAKFQLKKTQSSTAKLADLLPITTPLPVGSDLGPIEFILAEASKESAANIEVKFKQDEKLLGTGNLSWLKKNFYLALKNLTYDAATKNIQYEVIKSGSASIDAKDDIRLEVIHISDNKEIGKKELLLENENKLKGSIPISFKKEKSAEFKVSLFYGVSLIDTQYIKFLKADQLELNQMTRALDGSINYLVTNKGASKLKNVSIKYECISGSATINAQTSGQLIQSFDVAGSGSKNPTASGSLGQLKLNSKAASFKFTLLYDNAEVMSRIESFYHKNFHLQLSKIDYNQEDQAVNYSIDNLGKEDIIMDDSLLLVYNNSNPNSQATLNGKRQDAILISSISRGNSFTSKLAVHLGNEVFASFDFILKLGDVPIGLVQTVSCAQEDVQLVFDHPEFIRLGGEFKAAVTTNVRIKNIGKDQAKKEKVNVFIKKLKGKQAHINASKEDLVRLDVPQDISGEESVELLKIRIDPKHETEVDLELTLKYGNTTKEARMHIGWKTITNGTLEFPDGADLVGKDAQLTALQFTNTSGRTLDLAKLHLSYEVQGDGKLLLENKNKVKQDIHGKTLQELAGKSQLHATEFVSIPISITSKQESTFNVKIIDGATTFPNTLNWKPFPTIKLSLADNKTTIQTNEAVLEFSEWNQFTKHQLDQIIINCAVEKNKSGNIKIADAPNKNKELHQISLGSILDTSKRKKENGKKTIRLKFDGFSTGNTTITISLSGPVESMPFIIKKIV